jgi:hypothetical protein
MQQLQELIDEAQFADQLKGRRVDRVAAEIAEEIGVFFQHDNVNARARQQKSHIIPAGPPPAMQHCVVIVESAMPAKWVQMRF